MKPSLAKDLGIRQIHIASDCKIVVNHIHEATGVSYGGVIKDIKPWERSFISCNFVHESRDSNFEPYTLARHTLLLDQRRHVWLGLPHDQDVLPIFLNIDQ